MKQRKRKRKHRNRIRKAVLGVLLFLGILFFLQMAVSKLAFSLIMENILIWAGRLLTVIITFFYLVYLERQDARHRLKQTVTTSVIVIVVLFSFVFVTMFHQQFRFSTINGKNINVGTYSHSNTDFGSTDLESLIQDICKQAKGKQVERIDLSDYHEVIYHSEKNFVSYAFLEENGRYFYLGT